MTITLLQLLYSLVLIQATTYGIYSAVRLFPRGLTMFLIGVSAQMLLNLIYEWQLFNTTVDFSFGWASLYGPAFYFYIRSLSLRPIPFVTALIHLTPFLLVNLLNITRLSGDWLGPFVGVQLIAYLFASALFIYRAYRLLPAQHSEPVAALMIHTRTMLGLFAILLIYDTWARSQVQKPVWLGLSFSEMTLFGVLVLINIMFFRQVSVPAAKPLDPTLGSLPKTIKKAPIDDDVELAKRLINQTQEQALYLRPNLTLARLADTLGISEKRCSDVLNNQLGISFSDFINQLRVKACQESLLTDLDKNVLEIGLEKGFNSKTAFNAAFRKFANQTPTQYRKSERTDIGQ